MQEQLNKLHTKIKLESLHAKVMKEATKVSLKPGEEAPKGAAVQTGPRGGKFYFKKDDEKKKAKSTKPTGPLTKDSKKKSVMTRLKSVKKVKAAASGMNEDDKLKMDALASKVFDNNQIGARTSFSNMDTALKDEFISAFTNGGKDQAAVKEFERFFNRELN